MQGDHRQHPGIQGALRCFMLPGFCVLGRAAPAVFRRRGGAGRKDQRVRPQRQAQPHIGIHAFYPIISLQLVRQRIARIARHADGLHAVPLDELAHAQAFLFPDTHQQRIKMIAKVPDGHQIQVREFLQAQLLQRLLQRFIAKSDTRYRQASEWRHDFSPLLRPDQSYYSLHERVGLSGSDAIRGNEISHAHSEHIYFQMANYSCSMGSPTFGLALGCCAFQGWLGFLEREL